MMTACRAGLGFEAKRNMAIDANISAGPCCQRPWLLVVQTLVPGRIQWQA